MKGEAGIGGGCPPEEPPPSVETARPALNYAGFERLAVCKLRCSKGRDVGGILRLYALQAERYWVFPALWLRVDIE